eukprot:3089057-Rhodomonas_salina.2
MQCPLPRDLGLKYQTLLCDVHYLQTLVSSIEACYTAATFFSPEMGCAAGRFLQLLDNAQRRQRMVPTGHRGANVRVAYALARRVKLHATKLGLLAGPCATDGSQRQASSFGVPEVTVISCARCGEAL